MPLPTSILCPVDFSEHAERALRHARALAAAFHARLTVLTVSDPLLVSATAAAGHASTLRDQIDAALAAMLSRVPGPAGASPPGIEVAAGPAPEEILKAADRVGADLVVMGTQGLGGAGKWMFGSTTERVIRSSQVAVLAVPAYAAERMGVEGGAVRLTVGTVIAAIGFDALDTVVAGAAAEWAAACGAGLVLAHVCHEAPAPAWWPFTGSTLAADSVGAARIQLEALATSVAPVTAATVDVRAGAVPAGIALVARGQSAGLLVVSRGAGGHRLGTVAYRIMTEADIPTLVVSLGTRAT
jgi:nucleotide-binding universal stress UspA family protein